MPKSVVGYGKTAIGQLIYDLCFTEMSAPRIAEKHKLPVDAVRRLRSTKDLAELRLKVRLDRKLERKRHAKRS